MELVTNLKGKATEILGDLEADMEPILITQHGLPAACLLDISTFEGMEGRIERLGGIARGEQAIEEGRVVSHAEAKKRMKRWLD